MSVITVTDISVLDNPTEFSAPFQFQINFECLSALEDDLEWKLIYVGSAESEEHDQVLDSILVGPVPVGLNQFVFTADPPKASSIPEGEILGVTVVLVTCSYKGQEFIRVGYYVNNEYGDPEMRENPPTRIDIGKVVRNILDKPRVTKFAIDWGQ